MAFTTGSRCSSLREQMATSAPALANSIAMDLPMPVPPPVTIAIFPSRENAGFAMAGTILQGAEGCPRHGETSVLPRSEEHTSELQSRENLVCRLLLEKKKKKNKKNNNRKQSNINVKR